MPMPPASDFFHFLRDFEKFCRSETFDQISMSVALINSIDRSNLFNVSGTSFAYIF